MKTLNELKEGQRGIITRIKGNGAFRKRILEMGFIKGKQVTVVKAAPLQDPVEFRILQSNVSLRRSEAALIEVVETEEPTPASRANGGILSGKKFPGTVFRTEKKIKVALVGNPNSGKTTLFNHASHSREHTGNYAGVTIDSKKALIKINDYVIETTDLPGTYSITDYSPEELFVRKHIQESLPDIVINVIDASNLERNLYLTTQLIDMDIKVVIALNMFDEMVIRGDSFQYEELGKMLGIPFVPTIGSKGKGVKELFDKVIEVYEGKDPSVRQVDINYGPDLERSIQKLTREIERTLPKEYGISARYYAIKLLESDRSVIYTLSGLTNYSMIKQIWDNELEWIRNTNDDDPETLITNAKYGFIEGALKETFTETKSTRKSLTRRIDRFLTGKHLSYPIFILLMWVMFEATFLVGEYPVMAIEWLVARTGEWVSGLLPEGIVRDALVNGVIDGVGGVIVFLPNILILFFFISLMEDTGYMARVAFIIDKLMHKIGLHGKSFIPLLMGFGCNVPAIMATRTIESKSDRLVTMLITPLMSCSARYPVYVLLISAFFTKYHGLILFSLYMIGILLAAMMAFIFKKTLFRRQEIPFVMELPPYRVPTAKTVMKHTWFKGAHYLKKMGGIILVASLVIWALGYFPKNNDIVNAYEARISGIAEVYNENITDIQSEYPKLADSLQQEKEERISGLRSEMQSELQENSFIGMIGKGVEPVIQPLGFDWKMGVSLMAGLLAKEVVVSTMGVLYQGTPDGEINANLTEKIKQEEFEEGPRKGQRVFTPLVAFTFMVFVLIYFPCVAVLVAVRKESGRWKWALLLAGYTTALAWIVSFAVYNVGSLLGL